MSADSHGEGPGDGSVEQSKPVEASMLLGPWDGVSVILGIVIGVSLFKAPALIFGAVPGPGWGMALWVLGGALSLVGALCYAELATAYPRSGGDYVYLTRAYGRGVGFLFGWAQLVVILTGSIGAMAYVFADYAVAAWGGQAAAWAAASVVVLTGLNLFGVALGKPVQNALTIAKIVGLGGLVVAGFLSTGSPPPSPPSEPGNEAFGFALILVLYAYGGWNDAAFVAAEVRDPHRNVPRVLLLGTSLVVGIYLLVNGAYLAALGYDGLRASSAPAADVLGASLGPWAARAMSSLVMVSALGAMHGLIFTGSRIYVSVGQDHAIFRALGRWTPGRGAPVGALLAQGTVGLALVVAVGTETGQGALDAGVVALGLDPLPWGRFGGGFDTLVAGTAPVFWMFFLLTGLALPLLRRRDPDLHRPFRTPLYPLVPAIFCATSLYMLWASLDYARELALLGILPLTLGLIPHALSKRP